MPRRRILHDHTAREALRSAGECRAACVQVITQAPIGGPAYVAARQVLDAIDGLAEVLTGDRRHFHLRQHTAGGEPKR